MASHEIKLFYNLQMVLANVLYFFTGYKLTLVHSLVQTQLLRTGVTVYTRTSPTVYAQEP